MTCLYFKPEPVKNVSGNNKPNCLKNIYYLSYGFKIVSNQYIKYRFCMYDLSSVYYYLPKLLSQPTPTPGQGTMKYADGDQYEGEWKDGKRNGQGTYTWADGQEYL